MILWGLKTSYLKVVKWWNVPKILCNSFWLDETIDRMFNLMVKCIFPRHIFVYRSPHVSAVATAQQLSWRHFFLHIFEVIIPRWCKNEQQISIVQFAGNSFKNFIYCFHIIFKWNKINSEFVLFYNRNTCPPIKASLQWNLMITEVAKICHDSTFRCTLNSVHRFDVFQWNAIFHNYNRCCGHLFAEICATKSVYAINVGTSPKYTILVRDIWTGSNLKRLVNVCEEFFFSAANSHHFL